MFLVAGILVYRVYRPSRAGSLVHVILFGLRCAALLLCILLWMAPRLTIRSHGVRKPLIAVLIDNSESMQILSGEGPRYNSVSSLLESDALKDLENRARILTLRFDEALLGPDLQDSSIWQGPATDIATSLSQLSTRVEGEGLAGVFLLSDGAHNIGQNPAPVSEEFGAPIYAIPIGVEAPPRDVALASISVPSLGYVGRSIEIKARLESVGVDRIHHEIRVYDGERTLAVAPVVVEDGEQEVTFSFTPDAPGQFTLRVAIPTLPGEVEDQNNQELGHLQVLAARAMVFLAGSPSPDLAYVLRALRSDSNLTVDTVISTARGEWPVGLRSKLIASSDYDLVILHDVPQSLISAEIAAGLRRHVFAGRGLLVVGGEDSGLPLLGGAPQSDLLPIELVSGGASYVSTYIRHRISPGATHHPILGAGDNSASLLEGWAFLPPYTAMNRSKLREGVGATVLVEQEDTGDPLVAIRLAGRGKVAVVAARGFSRQALMMRGVGETDQVVRFFWKRMVRWLLTEDDLAKLRVSTGKTSYRSGERIEVKAELFDDLLRPVEEADVVLEVAGRPDDGLILARKEKGLYSGALRGLQQGTHSYRVLAKWAGGGEAGAVGELTIGRYSVEFEDLLANAPLMTEIARRSGGRVVDLDSFPAFVDSMKLAPQPHVSVLQLRLWGLNWPLVVLVLAFGSEWFVRRSRGMV